MTWINRLRLFAGLLGVILVVAVLTLIFNQRQTQAASLTATVATDTYDVGAAYGGTVTKQYVKEGDVVEKGQQLFTIQSVALPAGHRQRPRDAQHRRLRRRSRDRRP